MFRHQLLVILYTVKLQHILKKYSISITVKTAIQTQFYREREVGIGRNKYPDDIHIHEKYSVTIRGFLALILGLRAFSLLFNREIFFRGFI